MLPGFIVLFIAGIFQGSFGLGYKKYPPFSWAAFRGLKTGEWKNKNKITLFVGCAVLIAAWIFTAML